jgi:frataxin-like iron-binding protein CyaY
LSNLVLTIRSSFTRFKETAKVLLSSSAFLGLLVIVGLNVVFLSFNPFLKADPDALPAARSWVWWATQDYLHHPAPKVVLVGSSMVMNASWLQEAAYTNKDVDFVVNHRSTYLQSVVEKYIPGAKATSFNFGMPGEMVSDAYMIQRALFKGQNKPKVVALCLGTRDFMDTSFDCAAGTKPFQYLERFTDTHDLLELSMPNVWQRKNFYIKEFVYFEGKKWPIQVTLSERSKEILQPLVAACCKPSALDIQSEEDKRYAFYRSDIEKGVWIAHPTTAYHFYDNSADWQRRHKTLNQAMFDNQVKWLELSLDLCKKEQITPVIVNVPISPIALSLMPAAVYKRHIETLQAVAAKYGCSFVDSNAKKTFAAQDFTDVCHMGASGGEKLLDVVGQAIASDPAAVRALTPVASRLADKPGAQVQ